MKKNSIRSINFHIWKPCNFKCKYCFATFEDSKEEYKDKEKLNKSEMLQIIDEIVAYGFEKITFVGGEPLLCPWLDELIIHAKKGGLTTMIVTNGYLLKENWLKKVAANLDWVTISIDTLKDSQMRAIGRSNGNKNISEERYLKRINLLHKYRIKFKMNTVVNAINYKEDLSSFVKQTKPERWKVFQVLPIKNQRVEIDDMKVSEDSFNTFVKRHEEKGILVIAENNNAMINSYLMIDPLGRFFDNTNFELNYSQSILEVGFEKAMNQIKVSEKKYFDRGGEYNWSK